MGVGKNESLQSRPTTSCPPNSNHSGCVSIINGVGSILQKNRIMFQICNPTDILLDKTREPAWHFPNLKLHDTSAPHYNPPDGTLTNTKGTQTNKAQIQGNKNNLFGRT